MHIPLGALAFLFLGFAFLSSVLMAISLGIVLGMAIPAMLFNQLLPFMVACWDFALYSGASMIINATLAVLVYGVAWDSARGHLGKVGDWIRGY